MPTHDYDSFSNTNLSHNTHTAGTCISGGQYTHNKTHPKYAFVPVLSITALVKEFSPVAKVMLPVRVKVAKSTFTTLPGDVPVLEKKGASHTRHTDRHE